MPHKAQVIFLLLIISADQAEPLNCDDYQQGNGLIVSSTCYPDGKVIYSWHCEVSTDGILINYNCTGNTEEHGVAYGFADRERGTRSRMINNWDHHNTTCYFSGCYAEAYHPFNTYSISSTPCTVLVPSSTREFLATPTFLSISTVVIASRTTSLDDETSLTSLVRPSNPSPVGMQRSTTSVSVPHSMGQSTTTSNFTFLPMSTVIASRSTWNDDKNPLTFSLVHPSVLTSINMKTITTAAILAPAATSIFIITLLLLLVPVAVAITSRKRRKHLTLHGALGYKVDVEDSFDINVKIQFSKSLETIPDALFYNEKDLEVRVQVESHTQGGTDMNSILECGTCDVSTPQEEMKMFDVEEEEAERLCNGLAALPNCIPLKNMGDTSASTDNQDSGCMLPTADITSHCLDFRKEIAQDDFDASNLNQSHDGSLFAHGVQLGIGIEADFDPMSMTEIPFQDEEEGNCNHFGYVFDRVNSAAGYDDSGVTDGDVGDESFSGSYYIHDFGDTAPAAAD